MKASRKISFLSLASTALSLALVWSVVFTQSALSAVTAQWDAATGSLTITSDGNDAIVVTCETSVQHRAVLVNGDWNILGNSMSVQCADVKLLTVNGGSGDNLIDLRGVGPDNFPNIANGLVASVQIDGGDGNDEIFGSDFNDEIFGDVGNDVLNGGAGTDILYGGAGNDILYGGAGDDTLYGEEDNDRLESDEGNDTLDGGAGNDYMEDGAGNDMMFGGGGDDTFNFTTKEQIDITDDIMFGSGGNDTIVQTLGSADIVNDSGGDETLNFSEAASAITIDLDLQGVDQAVDAAGNTVQLRGQFEHFIGNAFDDTVSLDPLNVPRNVSGGAGNDTLTFDAKGLTATDNGTTLTVPGYAPVTYTDFATVNITNTGEQRLYLPMILR